MGCDIHLTVERKVSDQWVCVDTCRSHHVAPHARRGGFDFSFPVATDRNYERFAALAGVRGAGPKPRGLPDDLSQTTRFFIEQWDGDGHSHSWLSASEAAAIFLETERGAIGDWAREFPACFYFNIESEKLDEHRVVFWFDN